MVCDDDMDDEPDEKDDDVDDDGELGGDKYGGLSAGLPALSFDRDRWVVWPLPSDGLECEVDELGVEADKPCGLDGSEDGRCPVG